MNSSLQPCIKNWPIVTILCTICLFAGFQAKSQDLHFSQFMNNPLLTNPANTGFNPDHDYRIGASYRSQWTSVPIPYKTISIWGDMQLVKNRFENGWLGAGGVLLRDVAGSGNLTSTKAYGSIAYHQELGYKSLLSLGFNVGYASKSVDFSKFNFENQWTGKFFDAGYTSGESFAYSQIGYFDIQTGVNYAYFPSDNLYINGGVSVMHLNNPKESFFDAATNENKVPLRSTMFLNASIKLNDQWIINPNVYYSGQAGTSEIVGGMMAQYNLSGDGATQLIGGAYYRVGDAAVAMIGLEWNKVRVSFTYDATVSSLRNYNNGRGGAEFSIMKFGSYNDFSETRQTRCPTFN